MHAVGITRKIDKVGRIVIPIELRDTLGLDPGAKIELFIDTEEKALVMQKYQRGCSFCGEMKNTIEFKDEKLCKSCAEKIINKARSDKEV